MTGTIGVPPLKPVLRPASRARFRKRAEFDGAFLRTFNFVDGAGDARFGDEGFVGGVEEQHCFVGQGIVDPLLQILFGGHGTRRVVGVAKIDDVYFSRGNGRSEAIFLGAGQVDHAFVVALFVGFAGAADHDVGVIDRGDQ